MLKKFLMNINLSKSILVLSLFLWAEGTSAQFNQVWAAQYQHASSNGFSNEAKKVVQDAAGNIFMLSDVTSDIDSSGLQGSSTWYYVNITKYSTNGGVLNSVDIDVHDHISSGTSYGSSFGLITDAAGSVYVGYSTWNTTTGFDVALAKFDNNLSRLWTNSYPLIGSEMGIDMKLHASGTLYAILKSVDLQTVYSVISSVPSNGPATLVYAYPGNGVVLNSLALDNSLTAYVVGYAVKGGNKNAYIAAIDISLNDVEWSSMYSPKGIAGDDVLNHVAIGVDGNIYSAGTSYQGTGGNRVLALKNIPGNSKFDFVVLLRGTSLNTAGYFIDNTESGWVCVGAASIGDNHAYVFRFPDDGIFANPGRLEFTPVPVAPFNAVTDIVVTAMKVTAAKNVYITGSITSSGPSGNFTAAYIYKASVVFGNVLINTGSMPVEGDFNSSVEAVDISLDFSKSDIYWLRNNWDDTHSKETIELIDISAPSPLREGADFLTKHASITVGPNPAAGFLTIQSEEAIQTIELMDLSGKIILAARDLSTYSNINLTTVLPGIYFCKVRTGSSEIVKKIIIQ
jgi:hypothetical protein